MKKAELILDSWWNLSGRNLGEYLSLLSRSSPFMKRKRYLSSSSKSSTCRKKKSGNKRSPWNQMIPKDVLEEIALKLSPLELEWMGQVCQHWKSILKSEDMRKPPKDLDLPWLVLPQDPYCNQIAFYGLSSGQIYRIELPKLLQGGRCSGASKGWLVVVTGSPYIPFAPYIPHLWDPISGETISLPSLKTMPNFNLLLAEIIYDFGVHSVIRRIEVISVGSDQLIVAAIFGLGWHLKQKLGFCRPQDRKWTVLKGIEVQFIADILFHNGVLYVLTKGASQEGLFLINLGDCELRLVLINLDFHRHFRVGFPVIEHHRDFRIVRRSQKMLYLAESSRGELLLVSRILDRFENRPTKLRGSRYKYWRTSGFKVNVINFEPGKYLPTFTRLRSLEDEALFVASSGSLSHRSAGIDKKCINFLAVQRLLFNSPILCRDSGVFHFQGRKVKRSLPSMRLPIQSSIGWFIPKLP